MNIFVLIKQVPETDGLVLDEATGTVRRDGVESIVNPLDLYALETALRMKDQHQGSVITVMTMGPPNAERALREALSMGADRAVLLSDRKFAGSDTLATSYVLSSAVAHLGDYDLIICGEKATDGDTAQVGPGTASFLGLPAATFVSSVEVSGGVLYVERMLESGIERFRSELPALITVLKAVGEPRLPTLEGKRGAKRTEILKLTAEDLGLDESAIGTQGSPTRVHRIHRPRLSREPEIIRAAKDDEIERAAERLIEFLDARKLIPTGGRI